MEELVQKLWLDLLEKSDRTSPAEHPNMVLITLDEFRDALYEARNEGIGETR